MLRYHACLAKLAVILVISGCDGGGVARVPQLAPCHPYPCHVAGDCWRLPDQTCDALSDADCQQAAVCTEGFKCQLSKGGECDQLATVDCATTLACKARGMCQDFGGVCRPASDAMCRSSDWCKAKGECTLYITDLGERYCKATSAQDCALSDLCKTEGLCSHNQYGCVAASGDHASCQASDGCKLSGHCWSNGYECVLSGGAVCGNTPGCEQFGLCQLNPQGNRCVVASDADCAASKACKDQGKCFYSDALRACAKQAPVWPPNW